MLPGPVICRLVESQADPQPMLTHARVVPLPPEQVTVMVAVVFTAVPGRTLMVPNAALVIVTVQVCACAPAAAIATRTAAVPQVRIRR